MVRFEPQNLLHPSPGFWRSEAFDIVFCRNVLMYFTPAAAAKIVANIARSLSPGGYLFLGHAESLRGLSHDFHLRQSHGTFYYQRRSSLQPGSAAVTAMTPALAPPPRTAPGTDTSWVDTIGRASGRIEQLSRGTAPGPDPLRAPAPSAVSHVPAPDELSPAMDLMEQERFQEALRLLASTSATGAVQPEMLLLRAMLLVSTGELARATQLCEELLAIDELNAGAHYITAMCLEHAGDRTGAVEHSHAAAYLDSGFSMPHLQLGRLARRAGDLATARRELGLAIGLLAGEDAARIILFGGGFGRDALVALCRGELDACGVEP
jgi:chemotaxis protein methyltransferase CheR